jgi:hypothetical protein
MGRFLEGVDRYETASSEWNPEVRRDVTETVQRVQTELQKENNRCLIARR